MSEEITRSVIERGDLAHLALFLWAVATTLVAVLLLRELTLSNRRFSDFVAEIARLNRHLGAQLNQAVNPVGQPVRNPGHPTQNKGDFRNREG
ncbi:hypothetical protein [Roseibium sp.]|uniref:hypothetical protein n=1 Tax=Roseibium sp. TaxID=1936156 RepID=UPI003A97A5FC